MEIVDITVRRKIDFMFLWDLVDCEKVKELDSSKFKLWYIDKIRSRNGVRIIIYNEWKKNIVDVKIVWGEYGWEWSRWGLNKLLS